MKNMTEKEFSQKITNRLVLFDTGVIIRAFGNFDAFKSFFVFLKENECSLVYSPLIEFEFTRGAYETEHKKTRKEFLKFFSFSNIPLPTNETISDTIKIANAYSARRINSPSFIDCCIAAYLKNYHDNLFLVTLNHKDFPTFLFDRVFIYPINTEKDIFTLAFYKFNINKCKKIGAL